MVYREVTMLGVKEVLRQWLGGERKRAIARRVGVARNTVRGFIKAAEDCGLRAWRSIEKGDFPVPPSPAEPDEPPHRTLPARN